MESGGGLQERGDGDPTPGAPSEKAHLNEAKFKFSEHPSLEEIRVMQEKFANERNWEQFHQPRNLLLALVGEVGELAEVFQWKGEVDTGLPGTVGDVWKFDTMELKEFPQQIQTSSTGFSEKEKNHVAQEMSDILVYLVRLADRCHIDLPKVVVEKIGLNSRKYPVDKVRGRPNKYTEYSQQDPQMCDSMESQ